MKEDKKREMGSEREPSRTGGGANGGRIRSYSTPLGTVASEKRAKQTWEILACRPLSITKLPIRGRRAYLIFA
jgi:hypothetical protein